MEELINKQIKNIQNIVNDFFDKLKEEITLEEFIEFRDSINDDTNEALSSWYRCGTGRWAIGFDKFNNNIIGFGYTNTNNNYSFSSIDVEKIITSKYNRELKQIILKLTEQDIEEIIQDLLNEIENIKNITMNIKNFEQPKYDIIITTKKSDK